MLLKKKNKFESWTDFCPTYKEKKMKVGLIFDLFLIIKNTNMFIQLIKEGKREK